MEQRRRPIKFELDKFNSMGKIQAAEYVASIIDSVEMYHMGFVLERDRAIFKMKDTIVELQAEVKRLKNGI